jgi:predicted transcriptional regulator of viral defense system
VPEPRRISPTPRDENAKARSAGEADGPAREARASQAPLVARVAGAQWGVIDLRQLRDCGVSSSSVSRWAKQGRLHPRYPGVYSVGHTSLAVEGELTAALLAAGPDAVLSHATAAWWWGLIEKQPPVIEVSVPPGRRARSRPGLRIHRRLHLERAHHRHLPITTPIQTLLDFASAGTIDEVRRALAQAEFKNPLDLVVVQVRHALGRGRPGSATLRAALERHLPELARTRSQLERAFLALCEATGLPMPEVNVWMYGFLVDAVWREQRVVVELDGLQGHRTPAQLERDHERDLVLRQNRFETRRYTWQQVTRKPDAVFADLPRAVRALVNP